MYDFILQMIFTLSVAAAIYLISRAVPRISETGESRPAFFDKWLSSGVLERVDIFAARLLEKILRKIKVTLMRIDNTVSGLLDKVKPPAAEKSNGDHLLAVSSKDDEVVGNGGKSRDSSESGSSLENK